MLYIFLVVLLLAGIVYGIISLFPKALSPADKLALQQGHINNTILGESAGEITLPLALQNFAIFHIEGNYITDIFTQLYNNETLYSFLYHGKTFHTKWSLSNPIPGAGLVGETEIRCWLGKLPVELPNAEVFYRHIPQDVSSFCTQKIFLCGNKDWDKKYAFAGDPKFVSFLSPSLISWIEKNRLYIMISSGWMLLIDVKGTNISSDKQIWQNQMQDMSAWISLQDILIQKSENKISVI
ncbi:MAG: hypothetical protein J6S61_01765 [Elusimicrobiaceae bacterium]|nr:hypothetical protein [Elusimicrobiaceae bacterium]